MSEKPLTFTEFWAIYLAAHKDKRTRAIHYVGTVTACLMVLCFLASGDYWVLLAAPVVGYAPAWFGHAVFERNRPATFSHPWWSLRGDFRMLYCAATGRLGSELTRAGIAFVER